MKNTGTRLNLSIIGRMELLHRSPYFYQLTDHYLKQLNELIIEEYYERDVIVLNEGDQNRFLYFVASGAAKNYGTSIEGKEQIIAISRPGDSFNDVAAFDGEPAAAGAQALTPLVTYKINGEVLLARSCEYGPLAANIIQALAKRVRQSGELVADLSFRPVMGRLAKILLEQFPQVAPVRLTQRDLAAMAGTAREVVARTLKDMELQGLISIENHKIIILNPEELSNLVG